MDIAYTGVQRSSHAPLTVRKKAGKAKKARALRLSLPLAAVYIMVGLPVGYICAQTSNLVSSLQVSRRKNVDQLERLITVLEDWKQKDTASSK